MENSFKDNNLYIGANTIVFNSPIKEMLEFNNIILVVLKRVGVKVDSSESMNQNIVAFNKLGEKLWVVQEAPSGGQRDKPYISLFIQDENVIAYNSLGFEYQLDLQDGSVHPLGGRPW